MRRALAGALVLGLSGAGAMAGDLAVPRLAIEVADGTARIEAGVEGRAEGAVSAWLDVSRQGASGSTRTRQGRSFDVSPGSHDAIAALQISVDPGSEIHAVLTIESGGEEIARIEETRRVEH